MIKTIKVFCGSIVSAKLFINTLESILVTWLALRRGYTKIVEWAIIEIERWFSDYVYGLYLLR